MAPAAHRPLLGLENCSSCKVSSLPFASIALCWGLAQRRMIPGCCFDFLLPLPPQFLGSRRLGCQHSSNPPSSPRCLRESPLARDICLWPPHLAKRTCTVVSKHRRDLQGHVYGCVDACEIRTSSYLFAASQLRVP